MQTQRYLVGTAILFIALAAAASDLDSLTRGSKPTGSQQPLCSTSSAAAAWEAPVTCGLAISSNTPSATNQPLCGTASGAASYGSPAACGLAISANSPTGVQPLCGYPDAGAAYGSALTCGLAVSNNSPGAAGNELCVYADAGASFDSPANCFPNSFTVPTVTTTASLVIGTGNAAILNSKTTTIVLSGSLAAQTCSNTCVALNGGQGYPIGSCLPQAGIITAAYMDGTTNACIHACNVTAAAITLSVNCYVREFQ